MGMFDYIKYTMDCPTCGTKIKRFQSKDAECMMNELEYWQVDNFYSSCSKCKTWVEFNLRRSRAPYQPIENYEMEVEKWKE